MAQKKVRFPYEDEDSDEVKERERLLQRLCSEK